MIASGLGGHIFSNAVNRGIFTIIEPKNIRLKNNTIVVSLQQLNTDMVLCSFQVGLGATHRFPGASASTMSFTAHVNADTWHRRLGHMNPRNMGVFRRKDGNGID